MAWVKSLEIGIMNHTSLANYSLTRRPNLHQIISIIYRINRIGNHTG